MLPNITDKNAKYMPKAVDFSNTDIKIKAVLTLQKAAYCTMSDDNDKQIPSDYNADDTLSPDYAVALGYDIESQNAPTVVAKGQGHIARKIVQIALDEGIEIHKDADLVQILKAVDIDSEIPLEAFGAVAEIISYIYKANGKLKG